MFKYSKKQLDEIEKETTEYLKSLPNDFKKEYMMKIGTEAYKILGDIKDLQDSLECTDSPFILAISLYVSIKLQSKGMKKNFYTQCCESAWDSAEKLMDNLNKDFEKSGLVKKMSGECEICGEHTLECKCDEEKI